MNALEVQYKLAMSEISAINLEKEALARQVAALTEQNKRLMKSRYQAIVILYDVVLYGVSSITQKKAREYMANVGD